MRTRMALRRLIRREKAPLGLLLVALLLGAVTGCVATIFEIVPETAVHAARSFFRGEHPFWHYAVLFCVSGAAAAFAIFLSFRFAPEAGGSGIPEIEGALEHRRPIRWKRVLPVKLFGGMMSLSSGMILGREGPSIQIGGNLGKMVADGFLISKSNAMTLVAAGAAAGLAAAFNAPLAGLLFVLEELRPQFRYSFLSVKIVSTAVVSAAIARACLVGGAPAFADLPRFEDPGLASYPLFLLLGAAAGCAGYAFNSSVNAAQNGFLYLFRAKAKRACPALFVMGGAFGVLSVIIPDASGSGMDAIPGWITCGSETLWTSLALLLAWRFFGLLACFGTGIPGGIFAPSLSLGALGGAVFGLAATHLFPNLAAAPGVFCIAGMGALFAASVRAPVTGIVLVTEMTNNYQFLLPMMITTLAATLVAQKLGGIPIYTQILERTLRLTAQKEKSSDEASPNQPASSRAK